MFYNKEKMFSFLRMGSRLEAEKAKRDAEEQMANTSTAELDYQQAAVQLAEAIAQLRVIQQLRKK